MSSPLAAACQQIERASHTTAGQSLILPNGKISHQKVPKSIIQTYETALPGAEETSRCPSATLAAQLQALGRAVMHRNGEGTRAWGADKMLHCGISVASAARFMAEMGHEAPN